MLHLGIICCDGLCLVVLEELWVVGCCNYGREVDVTFVGKSV